MEFACFVLVFSVLLALRYLCLRKRELIVVPFVSLFDLRWFGFVCFLFRLVFGKECDLWLWHSLDFSLTFFLLTWAESSRWAIVITHCPSSSSSSVCPSVRPSTIFKQHLLLNHLLEFYQTSQDWSLVGPLSKLFKWFRSIAYLGHRS